MKVGVHKGSTFSQLLFIMIMDVLTEDMRDGSLAEMMYADKLFLCGKLLNEVMINYRRRKNAVKGKYIRVKTKGMSYDLGRKVVFQRWIFMLPVVSRLVVILFSLRNVRGGFIAVILMCLGKPVYYSVWMSFSVEHFLVIIVQ